MNVSLSVSYINGNTLQISLPNLGEFDMRCQYCGHSTLVRLRDQDQALEDVLLHNAHVETCNAKPRHTTATAL